jgi:hypothetical protein
MAVDEVTKSDGKEGNQGLPQQRMHAHTRYRYRQRDQTRYQNTEQTYVVTQELRFVVAARDDADPFHDFACSKPVFGAELHNIWMMAVIFKAFSFFRFIPKV